MQAQRQEMEKNGYQRRQGISSFCSWQIHLAEAIELSKEILEQIILKECITERYWL